MIRDWIEKIESKVTNPETGLPDELFYFVGRLTPFINVDLWVQHPIYGTLLTWRDDIHTGKGWHIPGGIIRLRESFLDRIAKVAKNEMGALLLNSEGPLLINEMIKKNGGERSHFISLLFKCEIDAKSMDRIVDSSKNNDCKIKFFNSCPDELLKTHLIYSNLFKN